MALSSTAAAISIQDGAGAVTNLANGANGQFTPGTTITFALQSTSGIGKWTLAFMCPAFPALHQRVFDWLPGMANAFQVPMPASPVVGTNVLSGIQLVSVVSDASGGTPIQSLNFLQTKGGDAIPMQHVVRACIPSALGAYTNTSGVLTANANGAIGAQDGVTLAVGDFVLLPNGVAASAADAGIFQVTAVGGASAKFVLTPSPDAPIGAVMLCKTEVLVQEGTLYAGTTWVNTLTGATNLIGTASFTFYPRQVIQSIVLVAGTATITNVPVVSATKSSVLSNRTTANTATSTTGGYHPVGAITPGALGTVSITFDATVAAGTINVADVSTLAVCIINPV